MTSSASPTDPGGTNGRRPAPGRLEAAGWRLEWLAVTAAAAAMATAFDSALLQQSRSLFTGGFLVEDYLDGPLEAVLFVLGSLLVDASVAGLSGALGLALAAGLGLGRRARRMLGLAAAAGPLLAASAIGYQVFVHLGAAFDAALMFELAGQRVEEFLAVASEHTVAAVAVGAVTLAVVAVAVWAANRRWPAGAWMPEERPRWRSWAMVSAAALVAGLVISTAMRVHLDSFDNGLRRKPAGRVHGILVATLSDVDRDGYGLLGRPADPAPFDSRIYPYAVDWPGNGIDENGVAGDLPPGMPPFVEPASDPPRFARRPPVVLFVLETFRADLLDAVVDGREVTPVLRELARRGVSSSHAYSLNGYTVQSRYHLFAGSIANLRGPTSLIDDFKANGYEVAYFSAQDESFGAGDAYDVGFSRADVAYDARQDRALRYTTFTTPGSLAVPFGVLRTRIAEFLAARRGDRPLFLYVNFHDTHFPYHHGLVEPLIAATALPQRDIAPGRRDDLWRTYANTAANVDRAIGEVIRDFSKAVGAEPGIIVTADHGESLYDEGFLGHGYALNDVQTRIPLVVANLPMRIREPFGQADLRDALRESLLADAGPPLLEPQEGPPVFQYLGAIDRPRQVAFVSRHGRTIYDFRVGRFRMPGADWKRSAELDADARAAFYDLVRTWERIRLARAQAGVPQ